MTKKIPLGQDLELTKTDLAELRSVGDEQITSLDRKLLEAAASNKSPDEIGEEFGIPPIQAANRIKDILRRRDWLSLVERKALLHDQLVKLRDYVQQQMDDQLALEPYETARGTVVFPQADPRWAEQMRKIIGDMNSQIDAQGSENNEQMNKIRRAHAKLMIGAISLAFDLHAIDMHKRYPEIDEKVLRESLELALPHAVEMIDAQVG